MTSPQPRQTAVRLDWHELPAEVRRAILALKSALGSTSYEHAQITIDDIHGGTIPTIDVMM